MRHAAVALLAVTVLGPVLCAPVSAQQDKPPKRTPEQLQAAYDAHKGDFDYLLGDWAFTAESKEYGTFRGYWSAVRLDEGQILDEYRVVGDKGETYYVTTSLRNYNRVLDRWELVGADAGTGLQDFGTGRKVGAEMHIEQRFGVMSDKPSLWKIRYHGIQPDRFSWTADRSIDGGKTWVMKHQTIEARRIGPPRSLGPLAPARIPVAARETAADPISGHWGTDGVTLLELTFDGKRAVSGTVIWRDGSNGESRVPIKTGSFDPKTGGLKLEGEAKRPDTGAIASYIIEATLDNGVLAGTYVFDDRKGDFKFTKSQPL
jgi:hypothetical protein